LYPLLFEMDLIVSSVGLDLLLRRLSVRIILFIKSVQGQPCEGISLARLLRNLKVSRCCFGLADCVCTQIDNPCTRLALSPAADDPLCDEQVGNPRQPGDRPVGSQEVDAYSLREWHIDAQHDSSKGQGIVADHPLAMRFEILVADMLIGSVAAVQPETCQHPKTYLGDDSAVRKLRHVQSAQPAEQDAQQVGSSQTEMDLE